MADAKVSNPENYDGVQGNDDVSAICDKLGFKNKLGADIYCKGPKGPVTVTPNIQPGWTK